MFIQTAGEKGKSHKCIVLWYVFQLTPVFFLQTVEHFGYWSPYWLWSEPDSSLALCEAARATATNQNTKYRKIPFSVRKSHFPAVTVVQYSLVAQKCCGDHQKQAGKGDEPLALTDCSLSGEVGHDVLQKILQTSTAVVHNLPYGNTKARNFFLLIVVHQKQVCFQLYSQGIQLHI